MQLPRFSFTIRRMMIFVAILGSASWGVRLFALSREYRMLAGQHMEKYGLAALPRAERRDDVYYVPELSDDDDPRRWPGERYHLELFRKYDRAARYPWLSVAPDPPEPE